MILEWSDKSAGQLRPCDIMEKWTYTDLLPIFALREIEAAERQAFLEKTADGQKQLAEEKKMKMFLQLEHQRWLTTADKSPEDIRREEAFRNYGND